MGVRKVAYVDIVAEGGAVFGVVVVAKNFQRGASPHGRANDVRDKVSFRIVPLPQPTLWIGAGRVKVTEGSEFESMSGFGPLQHLLSDELCRTVGAHRVLRGLLGHRQLIGISVDGRRGREDKVLDALRTGGRYQASHRGDVVLDVKLWFTNTLVPRNVAREMKNALDLPIANRLPNRGVVRDIALDERPVLYGFGVVS